MNYKEYLGDLIGGSLMLRESQTIAALLLEHPTKEMWDDAILNRNILQKRSVQSAKRNASTIRTRIGDLGDEFLDQLAFGNSELSTQLMFAACLLNSMLLADFMKTVVLDAKRMYRERLDASDWEYFWQERARLFPEFNKMTESTVYKIGQVAIKTIADAGYINGTREKKLQNVYLVPEVRKFLLEINRDDLIAAMEA